MPSNNRNYSPLIGFLQDSLDIPGWGQQLSDMFIDHAGTGANPWQGLFVWLGLLKFFRPFASSVKNCENSYLILFYPVRNQERRA